MTNCSGYYRSNGSNFFLRPAGNALYTQPYPYALSDLITDAKGTYSISSNYSGSVSVSSAGMTSDNFRSCLAGYDQLRYRYSFDLDIASTGSFCLEDLDEDLNNCLNGQIKVVDGVLTSINDAGTPESQELALNFESNFHYLTQKALNTEPFLNVLAADVWEDCAIIYGGVPAGNITNNITAVNYLTGPASSNNLMEELRAIAQAGFAHCFVQVDGKLTADPWWDCSREGDFDLEIPCSFVLKADRVFQATPPPTVIRVRGGFNATYNCGEVEFSDVRTSTETERSGYESFGGGSRKCTYVGINQKEVEVVNNNLAGDAEDLKNADIVISGMSVRDIKKIEDGHYKFTAETGSFFKGSTDFYSAIKGKKRQNHPESSRAVDSLRDELVRPNKMVDTMRDAILDRPSTTAGQAFGSGISGGIGHKDPTYTSKEPSLNQIEVVVYDPAAILQWGVIEEQVENKYITCKDHLTKLAVARFQQWKMEQNTWDIEIVPMPCLQLNDYVRIQLPHIAGCSARYVEGIIAGIDVSYSGDTGETVMKLVVWGTEELCNTTYTCGNLITNFCGINGDGNWEGAGVGPNNVGGVSNDALTLITFGNFGYAYVYLTQPCMEVGADYAISFDAELLEGASSGLTFNIVGGGVSVAIPATGTYSYTFTAASASHVMKWECLTMGVLNHWRVKNIVITKVITG
jgi:hypothetical protein